MAGSHRVLFATSNGTGLGHLNRAMAIARRLPDDFESTIFTLSQAAPVVAASGFDVDYLASYRRPGSGTDRAWNLRLRNVLADIVGDLSPDLIVFDGVHPYRALAHVLSSRGAPPSVWCRRPMWRPGSDRAPLRRSGAFDAVLEPGELAESADRGPTVNERGHALRVDPIVFLDRSELLDRASAAAALGLDPAKRTALVSLGQGGEVNRAVARALKALVAVPDLQVAALQSSIAAGIEVPEEVIHLSATFPMSRYYNAFDMAVSAAGYNAFHELIAFEVPTLFVPMERNTDDQHARSRWADGEGVALAVNGAADERLEERLRQLAKPGVDEQLKARMAAAATGNGAVRAAAMVARMVVGEAGAPLVRRRGHFNRWLRLSAHAVGPTLPLVAALGARDLLQHPERRRPQLLILALGVPEDVLTSRIKAAMARADIAPERVLVLTDSLLFRQLRSLGVGFELLPPLLGDDSLPAGQDIAALMRRVRLLTAGRRPSKAVSIGEHGAAIIGATDDLDSPSESA